MVLYDEPNHVDKRHSIERFDEALDKTQIDKFDESLKTTSQTTFRVFRIAAEHLRATKSLGMRD